MARLKDEIKRMITDTAGVTAGGLLLGQGLATSSNFLKKLVDATSKDQYLPEISAKKKFKHGFPGWEAVSRKKAEKVFREVDRLKRVMKIDPSTAILPEPSSAIAGKVDVTPFTTKGKKKIAITADNIHNLRHEVGHVKNYQTLAKTNLGKGLFKHLSLMQGKLGKAYLVGSSIAVAALASKDTPDAVLALTALPFIPTLLDEARATGRAIKVTPKGGKLGAIASGILGLGGYAATAATPMIVGLLKKRLQRKVNNK